MERFPTTAEDTARPAPAPRAPGSPLVRTLGIAVLLASGLWFVGGSWAMSADPDAVQGSRHGFHMEFIGLAVGLWLLAVAAIAVTALIRSTPTQRVVGAVLLGVLALAGVALTVVFVANAPGAWKLGGLLPLASSLGVAYLQVVYLRGEGAGAPAPTAVDATTPTAVDATAPTAVDATAPSPAGGAEWRPLPTRLARLLPVPAVLVGLTWLLIAGVTALPERYDWWPYLPGALALMTVLFVVARVALATVPARRLDWYERQTMLGILPLPLLAGLAVTLTMVQSGDLVTILCAAAPAAWTASLVVITRAARKA